MSEYFVFNPTTDEEVWQTNSYKDQLQKPLLRMITFSWVNLTS